MHPFPYSCNLNALPLADKYVKLLISHLHVLSPNALLNTTHCAGTKITVFFTAPGRITINDFDVGYRKQHCHIKICSRG
jgi:hypothetical protein